MRLECWLPFRSDFPMYSRRRLLSPSHLSLLLLSAALLSFNSSLASGGFTSETQTQKVRLDLYYESLCPYCSNFIVNYLVNIFDTGLISVVDLNLYPFGNARIGPDNTITCQHGSSECLLNTIEACAIDTWPDLDKHFAFIYCVESMVYAQKFSQWETCFDKTGLDRKPIDDCYSSGHGKELELKYAAETNTLKPPHEYVPWVVVDGQPLKDDYENFMSYICKAYKGPSPPGACKSLEIITLPSEAAKNFHPVSYREEVNKPTISKIIAA